MVVLLKKYWVYIATFLFIVLNSFLFANEFYYLALIPFFLVILFLALFKLDKLMGFIVFTTPLSLNLEELEIGGVGMYLPTEPLMFGVMVLFLLKLIASGKYDKRIFYHPVTIAIYINLGWIFITSITSELPVVSFKFLLARLWFVVCFYFIAIKMFKKIDNYKAYIWLYIIPLTGIIIYAVIRLSFYNFNQQPAHWVMEPFFKDHTSYGAVLALYFPILFLFINKKFDHYLRIISYILIIVFAIGIILSYTRAAWVSLLGAFVLFMIYKFRIKFSTLLYISFSGIIIIILGWTSLSMALEKNNQNSSDSLSEHVESISNVSTDASNLERLNRWGSAWRMFLERPIFGWGPGTYVFQYAPFQLSKDKTIITTNAGINGNAHSEYIGPLSESGVLGALTFIFLIIMIYYRGSLLYHKLPPGELKNLVLALLVALFTYFSHGFLNNYLDTDKASVPFWGFIALIVAIDIYHSKKVIDVNK